MLFNEINWLVIIILVGGYLFTFLSSTFLVRTIIKIVSKKEGQKKETFIDWYRACRRHL